MKLSPQDKAMLITFSGASFLILVFFFATIHPFDASQVEEFIPIPVIEEVPEEDPEEQQEQEELKQNSQISHQASNTTRLQREANRYFSKEDPVRDALSNTILDAENTEQNEDPTAENFPDYQERIALLQSRSQKKQSSGNDLSEKVSRVNTSASRRSTITYILRERDAVKIPNPVYTCDAEGKVVINIEVSGQGNVIKASYNKNASTTANGCLVDQALEYAKGAIFNNSTRQTQLGSISFEFQG